MFTEWSSPETFFTAANAALEPLRNAEPLREPTKPLKEAYSLGLFAILADAAAVRLNQTSAFDGWVRFAGDEIAVEVTEALEPGRKRDDEFRSRPVRLLGEADLARAESWPEWVRSAATRKFKKPYPSGAILFIYTSAGLFFPNRGKDRVSYLRSKVKTVPQASGDFGSVAVLVAGGMLWRRKPELVDVRIGADHW